ncbi:hypothetical protein HDU76_005958, partial [Blyttiomyces sp. JEL0837]
VSAILTTIDHFYKASIANQTSKSNVNSGSVGDAENFFGVVYKPIAYNPGTSELTVLYQVVGVGSYEDALGRATVPLTVETGASSTTFAKGQQITPINVKYPVQVDTSVYPFEDYSLDVTLILSTVVNGTKTTLPIALFFYLDQPLQSFTYDNIDVAVIPNSFALQFNFTFRRSQITKIIVGFTWVLLHMWAIMLVFLTAQCLFRDRDPNGFMVWAATSIFSMATIRGIQPNAPTVGTVYDISTYIWAVSISCLAGFVMFGLSFIRYKPKSQKDKDLEKKDKESQWRKIEKEEAEEKKKAEEEEAKKKAAEEEAAAAAAANAASYDKRYVPEVTAGNNSGYGANLQGQQQYYNNYRPQQPQQQGYRG